MEKENELIISEFEKKFHVRAKGFEQLKSGVSRKIIIRILTRDGSYIGINNHNIKENLAFFSYTETFAKCRMNVPSIMFISKSKKIYFLNDLGNKTLFDYIKSGPDRNTLLRYYEKSLLDLVKFQVYGKSFVDFRYCYETLFFNRTQVKSDFDKFSVYFIKKYSGGKLNNNNRFINSFCAEILNSDLNLFMYRDFQPRNIIKNRLSLSYVDYQSGRLGPPQYDLISFLYSGSIDITIEERTKLTDIFYNAISGYLHIDRKYFYNSLKYFALMRIVQLLGSYCYSFYENGNLHTLEKIPNAVNNLKTLNFREGVFRDLKNIILDNHS
ncbi:MAG: hypothetical protein MUE56_07480 [Ignavibacteria bacterium]|jgi:aminoglycoside/choline kinase family phosphotransferase|nr:hypothetical protein [Ignavibacteria bacterium]